MKWKRENEHHSSRHWMCYVGELFLLVAFNTFNQHTIFIFFTSTAAATHFSRCANGIMRFTFIRVVYVVFFLLENVMLMLLVLLALPPPHVFRFLNVAAVRISWNYLLYDFLLMFSLFTILILSCMLLFLFVCLLRSSLSIYQYSLVAVIMLIYAMHL